MRYRLIELIKEAKAIEASGIGCKVSDEYIADHLLAEGVIVPPCKVGDTVYAISESRIEECRVDEVCIYGNENIVMTEHTCDYDCKGCPFSSWGQDYSGEHSCQGEYGTYSFNFDDFGKTVFLTREEAEKALAERKEE